MVGGMMMRLEMFGSILDMTVLLQKQAVLRQNVIRFQNASPESYVT